MHPTKVHTKVNQTRFPIPTAVPNPIPTQNFGAFCAVPSPNKHKPPYRHSKPVPRTNSAGLPGLPRLPGKKNNRQRSLSLIGLAIIEAAGPQDFDYRNIISLHLYNVFIRRLHLCTLFIEKAIIAAHMECIRDFSRRGAHKHNRLDQQIHCAIEQLSSDGELS